MIKQVSPGIGAVVLARGRAAMRGRNTDRPRILAISIQIKTTGNVSSNTKAAANRPSITAGLKVRVRRASEPSRKASDTLTQDDRFQFTSVPPNAIEFRTSTN